MEKGKLLIRNITQVQAKIGALPPAKRILVLSPHQDDELIGCGGTVLAYLKEDAQVKLMYMTDGRYGIMSGEPEIRNEEARRVWEGKQVEQIFLNHEDSHLFESDAIHSLRAVIEEFQPDIIFTPWVLDQHIDHQYTTGFLQKALQQLPEFEVAVAMYEVMSPLYANLMINITKEFPEKMRMLENYKSQLKFMHIREITEALNGYRGKSMHLKAIAQAESFHYGEKKFFLSVVDELISIF